MTTQGRPVMVLVSSDKIVPLELENCPVCGGSVERDEVVPREKSSKWLK